MTKRRIAAAAAVASVVLLGVSAPAEAALPYKFANCTAMNKVYRHGVGKLHAVDKTTGVRVTTFRRDTALYLKIVHYRPGLDRDKDGIACEKR